MEAELATKKRDLEMAKLMPLLPTLTVGNEPTSLPRIAAAAKAKKEAEKAAALEAAQQAAQEPVTEPTPEPTPEPEPNANA
jgi:hypothetical protein